MHCIYRNMQNNTIYHCHISLYLQTTADQLIICTTTFHCVYRQLQINSKYQLPHFIVYTDNCRTTEYKHCHISFYLQTTADQRNVCRLPHFILFWDNCRTTHYMHCKISFYLQTTADQIKICTFKFHFYRQMQTKLI